MRTALDKAIDFLEAVIPDTKSKDLVVELLHTFLDHEELMIKEAYRRGYKEAEDHSEMTAEEYFEQEIEGFRE